MGRNLADNFAVARLVFEEADDSLGFGISRLCFSGPDEILQLTENTQPAILTVSVATLRVMQSEGFPVPSFVAGHSLGEYSALVAAGSLTLADAVRTVRSRGRYMQEAVPFGTGSMAAVIGADLQNIERICKEASNGQVCAPANINTVSQVVIAGNTEAVDRAAEMLKTVGARRVIRLNVSAPFHCSLMQPAQERLEQDLDRIEFRDLEVPLVNNIEARIIMTGDEARTSLIRQVSAPVRWLDSMELLLEKKVDRFVEVGPGKVLSGMLRQINRDAHCLNVEHMESLKSAGMSLGVLRR